MRKMMVLALLPLAACGNGMGDEDSGNPGIVGTGSGTTRTYAATGFTAVELRGADDVDVRVGSGFSVRAEGDPKLLDQLKIETINGTLRVGRISGTHFSWGDGHHDAKVFVTMPRLTEASIAGSGDMTVDRVQGASFKGNSAGSGTLSVGTLAIGDGTFSIAGSGDVKLAGTARSIDVSIAGSGDVEAGDLKTSGATVSIAGSGSVKAAVEGAAKVSLMGSGDVDLGPQARCDTSKMGSGTVRCGG